MGDVGEAMGDIAAADEIDSFDPGTDRGERRARLVTAIEEGGENRFRHRRGRRFDERLKPAGACTDSGVRRAKKDYGLGTLRRGSESAKRVRERIENDNSRAETDVSRSRRCFTFAYYRCSAGRVTPASIALMIYGTTRAAALLVHLAE